MRLTGQLSCTRYKALQLQNPLLSCLIYHATHLCRYYPPGRSTLKYLPLENVVRALIAEEASTQRVRFKTMHTRRYMGYRSTLDWDLVIDGSMVHSHRRTTLGLGH